MGAAAAFQTGKTMTEDPTLQEAVDGLFGFLGTNLPYIDPAQAYSGVLLGRLASAASEAMALVLNLIDRLGRYLDVLVVEDPESPLSTEDQIAEMSPLPSVDPLCTGSSVIGLRPPLSLPERCRGLPSSDMAATVPDALGIGALPDQVEDVLLVDHQTGATGLLKHPR